MVQVPNPPKRGAAESEPAEMHDEALKRHDAHRLPTLRPVFAAAPGQAEGTITAGNASSPADGAAAMLLARESVAHSLGIKPQARILAMSDAGQVRTTHVFKCVKSLQGY
jgi:acetyl-CoA C-acetyltransferase